jgi:rubredoxin
MSIDDKNARAMAAAQAAYDNAEPPEPREGVPMRCVQCGHHFDQSEAEPLEDVLGWACPACGDNDTVDDEPDAGDDFDPPDDYDIDEAAAFGGRDYP